MAKDYSAPPEAVRCFLTPAGFMTKDYSAPPEAVRCFLSKR